MQKILIGALITFLFHVSAKAQNGKDTVSITWRPGYLDIHHIVTGSGDCAFFVMPDGTTMLIDAGDIGDRKLRKGGVPLTSTPPYPNDSKTAGQWVATYINQVLPEVIAPSIDYAVLTHYHDDHIGGITASTKTAKNGSYKLTGITEVGDILPIKKLIDRNYPTYNFPTNLKIAYQKEPSIFLNLQRFIEYQKKKNGLVAEQLNVGSTEQIHLKYKKSSYPEFSIRGIKSNGTIWTGTGNSVFEYFKPENVIDSLGRFNENPLSLALKISYGKFDYFNGGDNTGLQGFGMPEWFDVETPMAKVVGKVEVMTLNHHGCRDAVNENSLAYLQPQTVVQQSWSSNHPGEEVLHRLISNHIYKGEKNIFATNIQEVTKATLGFWLTDNYKSTFGHIIIRVLPGGNEYYVLIAETINEKVTIKKAFGPFACS
ncbi:MAG TPA: MBL fold metallo-hydrolase [Saprospiraceae bacterium]|nr:MBL fold metallo-hydrolase [Saprospiraceae bacterium]HPN70126.1 MBL fold metallo-hydrolase [Saprospiraceae bacterium]